LTAADERLGRRIDEVDERLGRRIDEVDERLGNRIAELGGKLDDLRDIVDRNSREYHERLSRLENRQ
jgi:vacuolar-type H+-ATPase subunit I/STV1